MGMADVDLSGVESKLRRAKNHAVDLKERIDAWLNASTHSFTFVFYPKAHQYRSVIHDLPDLDPEWSLLVGEIVFHLRSCLDHLAWQLAIFDDKTPGKDTYYPIRDTPYDKNRVLKTTQLQPPITSPLILDALEATQPYRTIDGAIDLSQVTTNAFRAIRELNNIDKHRLLLVTAAVLDAGQMWWGMPNDVSPPKYALYPGVLKNDAPVAWFDFGPNEAPTDFDPHPSVRISIREPSVAFLTTLSVADYMLILCNFWVDEYALGWRFRPILNGEAPLFP